MPYWKLYYHAVWATRDREPLIVERLEPAIHDIVRRVANRNGVTVHEIGGTDDHLHLVIEAPPTIALAEAIGKIKGASTYAINREVLGDGGPKFGWQSEYGIVSFAEADLQPVCHYVRDQRSRHANGLVRTALELGRDVGDS